MYKLSHNNSITTNESNLTHQNSGLFLSACLLPKTKSSRDELESLFKEVRASARLTWTIVISKAGSACGHDHIRDNKLDRKNWSSLWFHTDYFIREYLFHFIHAFQAFSIYFSCL